MMKLSIDVLLRLHGEFEWRQKVLLVPFKDGFLEIGGAAYFYDAAEIQETETRLVISSEGNQVILMMDFDTPEKKRHASEQIVRLSAPNGDA